MDEIRFTIPLPPVTKKNSQRILHRHGANGKKIPFIAPSAAFVSYQEQAGYYIRGKWMKIAYPVEITAMFYTNRTIADLPNHLNALDDMLVKYGVIADDKYGIVVSHDGSRVILDKDNPRTEVCIKILKEE